MLHPALTPSCAARRQRLRALLGGLPALLTAGHPRPRNYLDNAYPFRASSHFLYFVGSPLEGAGLWIDGDQERLLVDPPADDHALWSGPAPSVEQLAEATGLEVVGWDALPGLCRGRAVATVRPLDRGEAEATARRLGRDPATLGTGAEDRTLSEAIVALRLQHDAGALRELRRAADVSVEAHLAGMRSTRPGESEQAVCAAMEHAIARAGFQTAYPSIVSVHGEVLHNHRHDHALAAGQLLLCDVGAESDTGYAADITRTWPVSGRFSATQRTLYELVLAMQQRAIEAVAPGVRYLDVHLAAARTLVDGLTQLGILRGDPDALVEDGAHAMFFPHGIGHLLGLDVHDMEDLGDLAGYAPGRTRSAQFGLGYLRLDRDLAPGMLVTIEPGFYQVPSLLADPDRLGLPGRALARDKLAAFADVRGIRIEDDVLVTERGAEVLTAALPKRPDEVAALVGAA